MFAFFLTIFLCLTALSYGTANLPIESSAKLSDLEENLFHSQASQDKFVYFILYDILNKKDQGYYLEIGAADPQEINNTFFFENFLKWKGVSIDISDAYVEKWEACRKNPLLIEDATLADYSKILEPFPRVIDYLSLDIDGFYDVVLNRIPFQDYIFKIITIEHDGYRFGNTYKDAERRILSSLGYYLLCEDVSFFEDWWIHPSAFPPSIISRLQKLDLKEKSHSEILVILQNLESND